MQNHSRVWLREVRSLLFFYVLALVPVTIEACTGVKDKPNNKFIAAALVALALWAAVKYLRSAQRGLRAAA